ncbi:MAG: alcohol dehydrogenase catalytic domain-containing protein [Anaerolineae bacterium]|nr:alcohol dehydrogenase catalytic domain-containing protein [Anaerolineae bacterium]
MLAAFFVGKSKFELRHTESPACPEGGLVVEVNACAICGTDLKIIKGADQKMEGREARSMELPRIIGHEISGTVIEVGRELQGFTVGENVVVAPSVPCMQCALCQRGYHEMCDHLRVIGYDCDGGFAEQLALDSRVVNGQCVLKVGEVDSLDLFALSEPLSCAINCYDLSPVRRGDTVVVLGAGPLGCFLVELAKLHGAGATIITDISAEQARLAEISNPDWAINDSGESLIQRVLEITEGYGADLVITACPSPSAQQDAIYLAAKRGSVNFFGGLPRDRSIVPIDTNLIHYRELNIRGTHGSRPEQVERANSLIKSGRFGMEKYITHRFPLNEINHAFEQAQSGNRLKILVKP